MASNKHDYVFFYGGIFSQWYHSPFTIEGVTYNCAEQYMMAKKALLFEDVDCYARIMRSEDPSEQKAIGKTVWNFNKEAWEAVARDIVREASFAKFTSCRRLYLGLMATGSKEIVEASPTDRIWGIGLSEYDDDRLDRAKWRGTNWLGEALMEVREVLRHAVILSRPAP